MTEKGHFLSVFPSLGKATHRDGLGETRDGKIHAVGHVDLPFWSTYWLSHQEVHGLMALGLC